MRVTNTTNLDNELIREIIKFVRPSGISNFDVMVKNSGDKYIAGTAYTQGNNTYHATNHPFVVCRIPTGKDKIIYGFKGSKDNPVTWVEKHYPMMQSVYQYAHLKGKRYYIANKTEALVYVLAHELRHLWQAKTKNKSGYYPKSRGRFSEIDTEGYAITKLRAWRKTH